MSEIHEALKRYFGHDAFLEGQEEIVTRLMAGEELCVVMPTGAGKSLGYQLPAVLKTGYTLIISPLISLMKDQVDALNAKGIAAAFINSTQSPVQRRQVIARWQMGGIKLLYVAPERLRTRDFRAVVHRRPPSLLAVDEAHCVSQWGHDFRPDYARIGEFIDELKIPQVCAFTATATPIVREDIVRQLHRPQMQALVTGFTRPNLIFEVHSCSRAEDKLKALLELVEPKVPTIIYASTRKNVEQVAETLGCLAYHAGLSDEVRTQVQNAFMQLPKPVIAATNAFGMGIDRPDIRRVIHYNIPSSLEAYYQEAGRAGRDGEDAHCHLLFSPSDRFVHEFLIDMSYPPEFVVHETWQVLTDLAMIHDSHHLEVTQSELADRVHSAKGEQQIGAALKILERHGYVERGYRQANLGQLRLMQPAEQLLADHPQPTTQRAIFVHRVLETWRDELEVGVECTMPELERVSGLRPDQLRRVLHALHGNAIAWTPPFAGRGVTLLKPDESAVDIDYTEQNRRKELELKRLDQMFAYPGASVCRQVYLINYFGQELEGWRCQVCDLCTRHGGGTAAPHEPSPVELVLITTALEAVRDVDCRFGKNRIAQMLAGSQSQTVMAAGLHHRSMYGALAKLDQPTINHLLEELLHVGCLQVAGDPQYPVLQITPRGREVIAGTATVAINATGMLPDKPAKPAKPARRAKAAADDEPGVNSDLYERLRAIRNELADKRHVPPYQILANAPLRELAERAPSTVDEALQIPGIGPAKARRVVPRLLEEIKAWRGQVTGSGDTPAEDDLLF